MTGVAGTVVLDQQNGWREGLRQQGVQAIAARR